LWWWVMALSAARSRRGSGQDRLVTEPTW
jgi:hypothetical protein